MKITGAALVLLGLVIGAYVGIDSMFNGAADRTASVIMMAAAVGSVFAGGAALAFGGKGFIVSHNPSVHN
jgi:hypothetical protein